MKILVIRFSSIGDIVLTTPIVRCLKQQIPNIEVHYLTKKVFAPVLRANPYIDKLHLLGDSLAENIEQLKKEQFDCVIDLHKNLRTTRIKSALKKQAYSFSKLNVQKWLYVNLKLNLMPDKSIVERYFQGVKSLGIRNDGQGLDYFIPEAECITNNDIPMSHWHGYLGFVIGGSFATKKMPVEKWIELCKLSPIPVILLGGPEDKADGDLIAAVDNIKIYNSCGKFSINESADLVKGAKLIVTNDTGLMHIAAAFQKPIASLWGNTTPQMGMFPYYGFNNLKTNIAPQQRNFEVLGLGCRPCSKIGFDACPKKHFNCMNMLNVKEINNFFEKYV